jgi:hypothetical protein
MNLRSLTLATVLVAGQIGTFASDTTDDYEDDPVFSAQLAQMQEQLRASGITHVAIEKAELLYAPGGWDGVSPHTVLANDRTHRFFSLFVENDPRRSSPPNTITYLVDQSGGTALGINAAGMVVLVPNAVTEPQLDAAMAAWDDFQCAGPNIVKVSDPGADPDWVDNIVSGTPLNPAVPYADIVHAGWVSPSFFTAVFGTSGILAATFTFIFVEDDGITPTDIDRDGRPDTAWREIYYNGGFAWWTTGTNGNADIQTAAIHEAGHGLGLAHFGKITLKADGTFQFSPKSIMNNGYTGEDRTIRGSDIASFCSVWANSQ